MLTFHQISAISSHRPTGFDYLRVLLAVAIIAWHSVSVCYGSSIEAEYFGPYRPLIHFLVPSFFALSGFLVAGSLFRTNHLPTFLTLRVLRIFPALCCEVIISAFIIGAMLTTLPLIEYLSHPLFHRYFLNIFGNIQYYLPGVFENNTGRAVNIQLWTIPYELECYIAISLISLVSLHRKPLLFVILLSFATIVLTIWDFNYNTLIWDFRPSGRFAIWAFLWGLALYLIKEKLPYNFYIFFVSILFAWAALQMRETEFLAAPAIAYITIYIGLHNFKRTFVLLAGDISYGLYLYGFAIQQATYQLLPGYRSWHENFIISLVVACIFGYLSWTYVELKVLNKKKSAISYVKSVTDRSIFLAKKIISR